MVFMIIILIFIIIILISYLFLVLRDLKRIKKELIFFRNTNSNTLIHKKISSKSIDELINEVNNLLKESRKEKLIYERKNRRLKKMIRNISHDLKTPLTSALGYINILNNSNNNCNNSMKELKIIEKRLYRLDELIKSFFSFSKSISNEGNIKFDSINLISVLEEAISHYYDDYNSKKRKIIFNKSVRKYMFMANYDMLIRIFENLISNAFIHSKDNLEINLKVEDKLVITFINKLVDKDLDVDHILDEFYTYDISRTKGNTGLGLCIAKEFTEKLGGIIKAEKKGDKLSIIIEFN